MFKIGKYTVEEPELEELLKSYIAAGSYTRGDVAHEGDVHVGHDKMMQFIRKLYRVAYKRMIKVWNNDKIDKSTWPQEVVEFYETILNDEKYKPENISDEDLIKMGDKNNYTNSGCVLTYIFHSGWPDYIDHYGKNGEGGIDWLEVTASCYNADERLYLNLKAENTIDFATEFITRCIAAGLSVPMFKFSTRYREDQFIIYTKAEDTEKYLDILEDIREEKPELCEGTENVDQNLGKINGWIGYGEDPNNKRESFTSVREMVVNRFFKMMQDHDINPNKIDEITPELIEMFKECEAKEGVNSDRYILNSDSKREKIIEGEGK